MDDFAPEPLPPAGDADGDAAAVVVATDQPLPIRVERLDDSRAPEGMVVLGSYLEDRLVARCAIPAEAATLLEAGRFFRDPARLVLAAREAPPGLQCQLFALVQLPTDSGPADEPWADSLPGASYDRATGSGAPDEADEQAAVLLGQIVRFARDRVHPGNLPLEAIDVLSTIVQGELVEVVDKILDDLLG